MSLEGKGWDKMITVVSLIVAALAVFVGPVISWQIARRQAMSSLEVANKQIVAPMRQKWINRLRELLAEVMSSAHHYSLMGFEDRTDEEYRRLLLLEEKIGLTLNPNEEDHRKLEVFIGKMIRAIERGSEGDKDFMTFHPEVRKLSREVLKREWDRVKGPIAAA